jgi:hypothetical protein
VPRPAGLNSESDLEGGGSADGSAQLHHSAGQADADRLARQAAVMAEATSAFLLAGAAGPGGRAVGLDLDPDALAIAHDTDRRLSWPQVSNRRRNRRSPACNGSR